MESLAIIDFESTGLEKDAAILEVSIRIVDTKTLLEKASLQALPALPDNWTGTMGAFVLDMHTKNGLLNRRSEFGPSIRQGASSFVELDGHAKGSLHQEYWARDLRGDAGHGLASLEVVEEHIVTFLKAHQTAGPKSLLLTGNSLAALDMRLMQRWLPGILEEMHYRTYDVSVVRTHYREVLQQPLPPKLEELVLGTAPVAPGEQAHRAADDTLTCLRSIRHLRSWAAAGYPEGAADFDNTPWTKGFGHEGDATWRL